MSTLAWKLPSVNNQPDLQAVCLDLQGSLVKLKMLCSPGSLIGGGLRGVVNHFSPASRRRLIQLFARLLVDPYKSPLFITLTYPAEYPHPRKAKEHLRTFYKRLLRVYPELASVWRLEFQKRGAPHFHLITFNVPYIPKEYIQETWGEIIGYETPFTRVEMIEGMRKLLSYVSKYTAKVTEPSGGFNHSAYLPVEDGYIDLETGEKLSVGRVWGIVNAEKLPFAELYQVVVSGCFNAVWDFRRAIKRRRLATRTGSPYRGCFLLIDEIGRWLDFWEYCLTFRVVEGKKPRYDPIPFPDRGGGLSVMLDSDRI